MWLARAIWKRRRDPGVARAVKVTAEEQTMSEAGLEIRADEQWNARPPLQVIELGRDFHRCAERHRHAADVIALDPTNHLGVR